MTKSEKAALIILGAAAGVAVWRFFKMPLEDRKEFYRHIKETTSDLLDNAEDTVEKVNQFISEIDEKGKEDWIDKLYVVKKMFRDLYGSEKKFLL
jgi:hypothetical protein